LNEPGPVENVCCESETNDPPTTNATSAFCAIAVDAANNTAARMEKRFIEAPLLDKEFFQSD
jgi:hypothetical protein